MNNFLKTRAEVDTASKYLKDNDLISSGLDCKNWEITQVIPFLKDGDLCDLGSDGSVVLDNAVKLGLVGRKVGIDLAYKKYDGAYSVTIKTNGVELHGSDLMKTEFPHNSFDIITCLSVIEHEVSFERFAKECSRLLKVGGKMYVSFDFWEPKPEYEKRNLYSLDWNILDRHDVNILIMWCGINGMLVTTDIDWTLQDAVINSKFCSPVLGVEYSFGILEFIKK